MQFTRRYCFNPLTARKHDIQRFIRQQYTGDIISEAVKVSYVFEFAIPKSFSKKRVKYITEVDDCYDKRPDTSNLVKFFDDCLIDTVIKDDCLITDCSIKKRYSHADGIKVYIEKIGHK